MSAPYLTPEELGERFGKNRQWVTRRCAAGHFPHIKIGNLIRFTEDHVAQI